MKKKKKKKKKFSEDRNKLPTAINTHLCPSSPTHPQTAILFVKTTVSQMLMSSMFELQLRDCTFPREWAQFVKKKEQFQLLKVWARHLLLTSAAHLLLFLSLFEDLPPCLCVCGCVRVCLCVCGGESWRLVCLYVDHPDSKHFDASEAERGSPTNSSIRQSQLTPICSAAAAFGGILTGWGQQKSLYFAFASRTHRS